MSNIEPTEEQHQAAQDFCAEHMLCCDNLLARLLAEREAKLREEIAALEQAREAIVWAHTEDLKRGVEVTSALRARVAELEGEQGDIVGCEGCGKRCVPHFATKGRDGMFEPDAQFAVFDDDDVERLVAALVNRKKWGAS